METNAKNDKDKEIASLMKKKSELAQQNEILGLLTDKYEDKQP